jgi:hypothetical protein
MRRGTGILLVLIVLGAAYAAWSTTFRTTHVRMRVTIDVDENGVEKIGSGVFELSYFTTLDALVVDGRDASPKIKGYAVTVDMGRRGLLFLTFEDALRTTAEQIARNKIVFCGLSDIGCLPFAAYGKLVQPQDETYASERKSLALLLNQSGPRDVPFVVLPRLARLPDDKVGTPLVTVSPFDLAASFGPGVRLKNIVLSLTDEPITPPPQSWPIWLRVPGFVGTLNGGSSYE